MSASNGGDPSGARAHRGRRTAPRRVSTQRRGAEVFATDLAHDMRRRGIASDVVALSAGTERDPLPVRVLGRSELGPATLLALRRAVAGSAAAVAHGSRTLPACAMALAATGVPFAYRSIGDPGAWSTRGVAACAHGAVAATCPARHRAVARRRRRADGQPRRAVGQDPRRPQWCRRRTLPGARRGREGWERVCTSVCPLTRESSPTSARSPPRSRSTTRSRPSGASRACPARRRPRPGRAALEAQAARDAPSGVRFVGALSDVAPVYAAADAVVLASRTEGMPGVLIEAGLSDRPAVAYDVGAVSEVVADGETGVLVTPGDVTALAAALRRVLDDPGAMGAAARERCLARFEIGVVGERWAEVVGELAAG